jgi:hypothetical protein
MTGVFGFLRALRMGAPEHQPAKFDRRRGADALRAAIKDPYGDPYVFEGFMYNTVSQMLGISIRPPVPMCFVSDRCREICDLDAAAIVDLGADGMRRAVRGIPLSYRRSYELDHLPLTRLLHPRAQLMTAINGFDEHNLVGQALVRRYLLSYEPYHFKGRLEDFTATIAYGRSMDALRTNWRECFWEGDYRDEVGAYVRTNDGANHHPFAVSAPAHGGHLGLAVANHSDESQVLTVAVDRRRGNAHFIAAVASEVGG